MNQPTSDLLKRYFNNQCSSEEAEEVLSWLATPHGQTFYRQYLDQRIEQRDTSFPLGIQFDKSQALKRIQATIEQKEGNARRRMWVGIAAALALLILSTWTIITINNPVYKAETAFGETQRLTLEDGTVLTLNANSKLRYHEENPREVWIEGEAFFEVMHTQQHDPFRVHTSDLTINVLGTTFNVNTRRVATKVVLNEGKVALDLKRGTQPEQLAMSPGDKVSFSKQTDQLEKNSVNPQVYTAWTQGTLVFDHTPLKEVFMILEDTYGVSVEVSNPQLLEEELSGNVDLQLEIIITLLKKSFGLNITKTDETIFVTN